MERRVFIGINILAALGAVTGGQIQGFRTTCQQIIREDIKELLIHKRCIDQFMTEADRERFWDEFSMPKKLFVMIQHPFLHRYNIKLPFFSEYLMFRNRVTGQFLLSTNLFYQKYDKTREIKYMGYHNPYMLPCSNPFMRNSPPVV